MATFAGEIPDAEGLAAYFISAGFPEKHAKKYAKSKKDATALYGTLKEAGVEGQLSASLANLMYDAAKAVPKTHLMYRPVIAKMVMESKLDTKQRISAAAKFLKKITPPAELDVPKLEEACGVGMHMTDEEIATLIDQVFESVADTLQKERYLFGVGKILPLVNKADPRAKWANGGTVNKNNQGQVGASVGPKRRTGCRNGKEK